MQSLWFDEPVIDERATAAHGTTLKISAPQRIRQRSEGLETRPAGARQVKR